MGGYGMLELLLEASNAESDLRDVLFAITLHVKHHQMSGKERDLSVKLKRRISNLTAMMINILADNSKPHEPSQIRTRIFQAPDEGIVAKKSVVPNYATSETESLGGCSSSSFIDKPECNAGDCVDRLTSIEAEKITESSEHQSDECMPHPEISIKLETPLNISDENQSFSEGHDERTHFDFMQASDNDFRFTSEHIPSTQSYLDVERLPHLSSIPDQKWHEPPIRSDDYTSMKYALKLPRTPLSVVWTMFDRLKDGRSQCRLCGFVPRTIQNNTTNMWTHLKTRHRNKFNEMRHLRREPYRNKISVNNSEASQVEDADRIASN